jgi:hypothetical protein
MPANYIFSLDMALGYLACALCIATYVWPRLRAMDRVEAHHAIATFNSSASSGWPSCCLGFSDGPHSDATAPSSPTTPTIWRR